MKAYRYVMKPLLDWVCKSQKWVENANQTQLKPIIWYTSWYFSKGGVKKFPGGVKIFFTPPTESLYPPLHLSLYELPYIYMDRWMREVDYKVRLEELNKTKRRINRALWEELTQF